LVEFDQQTREVTAHWTPREQARKLGVRQKPIRIEGRPVIVVAIRVGEDDVVDVTDLM
jgi:hypothetical protein